MALRTILAVWLSALVLAQPMHAGAEDEAAEGLRATRANSCGSESFRPTLGAAGQVDLYTHRKIGFAGATRVGAAVLEWCQSAQNAVIYFYVDDPSSAGHKECPEDMSVALFPGRGADARTIIDGNVASYHDPAVHVVEEPRTGPVEIKAGARSLAAYQLEGVIIDPTGKPRRHRMIGYAHGEDFVRVMTGVIDSPSCRNETAKTFLAKLAWP